MESRIGLVLLLFVSNGLGHAPSSQTPSTMVTPATLSVRQAVEQIHLDRWKLPRPGRDAAAANIDSIQRDLRETLGGLLASADASPDTVAGLLPLSRNLAALYEVMLRVTVVAGSSAPSSDAVALDRALSSLEQARRAVDDRVQSAAASEDRQLLDLKKQFAAAPAAVAHPSAALCAPPRTVKRKKKASNPPVSAARASSR